MIRGERADESAVPLRPLLLRPGGAEGSEKQADEAAGRELFCAETRKIRKRISGADDAKITAKGTLCLLQVVKFMAYANARLLQEWAEAEM